MAQYTIEDIEILRQKSGITYNEAVNLIEYHNGSLVRALVDLEKNGRIRDAKTDTNAPGHRHGGRHIFNNLYRTRLKVYKDGLTVANLSMLFVIFAFLVASWVLITGLIVALLMGYRIVVDRNSAAFSDTSLDSVVKNAGSNVKNTLFTLARTLNDSDHQPRSQPEASPTAVPEVRNESPASGTTPVNVQFSQDGNVQVTETHDGFHEADIQ